MAGIKKIAKEVAEGALNAGTLGLYGAIKSSSGMASCRKKGGKWVKGKCVMGPDKRRIRPDIMSPIPGARSGKKKYPGTGDWYPEKG